MLKAWLNGRHRLAIEFKCGSFERQRARDAISCESAVLLFQFGRIIGSTRCLILFRPDAESLPRGSGAGSCSGCWHRCMEFKVRYEHAGAGEM